MGMMDTLVNSIVKVISGVLGFGMFMAGGQQAAAGSGTIGGVVTLIGVVLLVFATQL